MERTLKINRTGCQPVGIWLQRHGLASLHPNLGSMFYYYTSAIRMLKFAAMLGATILSALLSSRSLSAQERSNETAMSRLSLSEAMRLASEQDPALHAAEDSLQAAAARASAARLLPNPTLEFETVSPVKRTNDSSELRTVTLGQDFDFFGKRRATQRMADTEEKIQSLVLQQEKQELQSRIAALMIDAWLAQEKLQLSKKLLSVADETKAAVTRRLAAGRSSALEEAKAHLSLLDARLEQKKAAQSLDLALGRLHDALGHGPVNLWQGVADDFGKLPQIPSQDQVFRSRLSNIAQDKIKLDIAREQSQYDLARAEAWPDINLKAGVEWAPGHDEKSYIFGMSLPLPVFNRGYEHKLEAQHNLAKARWQGTKEQTEAHGEINATYLRLVGACREAEEIAANGLSESQKMLDLTRAAYNTGRLNNLDVSDAQQTYYRLQTQYLDAVATCQSAFFELQAKTAAVAVGDTNDETSKKEN